MNDTKQLKADLIVECNRPVRDEEYIVWLKQVIALAEWSNEKIDSF